MSLITCPKCGSECLDTANYCACCGHHFLKNESLTIEEASMFENGYDLLLVDSYVGAFSAKRALAKNLSISNNDASTLLKNMPCYLYTDMSKDDAIYLANSLKSAGMRVAIYSPKEKVTYCTPTTLLKPLPILPSRDNIIPMLGLGNNYHRINSKGLFIGKPATYIRPTIVHRPTNIVLPKPASKDVNDGRIKRKGTPRKLDLGASPSNKPTNTKKGVK